LFTCLLTCLLVYLFNKYRLFTTTKQIGCKAQAFQLGLDVCYINLDLIWWWSPFIWERNFSPKLPMIKVIITLFWPVMWWKIKKVHYTVLPFGRRINHYTWPQKRVYDAYPLIPLSTPLLLTLALKPLIQNLVAQWGLHVALLEKCWKKKMHPLMLTNTCQDSSKNDLMNDNLNHGYSDFSHKTGIKLFSSMQI
jgi:hypothetical protein